MRVKLFTFLASMLLAVAGMAQVNITTQPADQSNVCDGSTVTFTVEATGTGTLSYQWQYSTDGTTFTDLTEGGAYSGTTTNVLSVTFDMATMDGYYFQCVVTDDADPSNPVTSDAAQITKDNEAPSISSAPTDETVAADANCQYTLGDQVTASDNCTADADLVITQSPVAGSILPEGATTVTLTVKDEAGNESTASFVVTVADQTPPEISASPSDETVAADANCQYTLGDYTSQVTASDNCTADADLVVTQSPVSGSSLPKGENTVVLTVKDEAGNESTASFVITVTDQTPPNVVAKQNTYNLNMSGSSITLQTVDVYDATNSSDNCGTIADYYFKDENGTHTTDATYTCSEVGTPQTLTLYAIDDAGNEGSVDITVNIYDTGKPVVTTKSYTAELDAQGSVTVNINDVLVEANDNCTVDKTYFIDGLGNEVQSLTFSCSNVGEQTVTVYAEDASGNIGQADAIVDVVDNINPTATVTESYDAILNGNSVTVNISDVATDLADNCGTPQAYFAKNVDGSLVTSLSFDCANQGEAIDTTVYVEDNNGNVSDYPITINVIDDEAPILSTSGGTFYLDGSSVTVYATDIASATDNCGTPDVFILDENNNLVSSLTYDCSNLGDQTVKVVARDGAGNLSESQDVTITIADNTAPSLTVTNKTVYLDENGSASVDVSEIASASDNCTATADIDIYFKDANGDKFYTYNFDCGSAGAQTITVYAEDASGNVTQDDVTITVEDNINPTINGQNIEAVLNGNSVTVTASQVATATDNCTDGLEIYFKDANGGKISSLDFTCADLGANSVTVYASDAAANEVSTTVEVDVVDNTAPEVTGLDKTFDYTGTAITITPGDVLNAVSDNCTAEQDIQLYFEDADGNRVTSLSFDCANIGDNPVRLYAEDASGNVAYTDLTVTVNDAEAPTINAVTSYTVYLDENGSASVSQDELVNSVEDCDQNVTVTLSQTDFSCDDLGTPVEVAITAADSWNNVSDPVVVNINVADTLAPVMEFSADTFRVETTNDYYVVEGNEFDPVTVSDNCSIDDIDTVNSANNSATLDGVQLPVGDTTIYWTATDGQNNEYLDSIVVIVVHIEATAINDMSSDIKLYPVPANDRLNIEINEDFASAEAQILDLTGKVIKSKKLNGRNDQMDLSGIDSGIYLIKINIDGKVNVSRIIKN